MVNYDIAVDHQGETLSPLNTDTAGSRFELWIVQLSPLKSQLLDTAVYSNYIPTASVSIHSEDPYSLLPRTRADRPFYINVTAQGILSGAEDPEVSKSVTLTHHAQSYGANGTGVNLDRTQATLIAQSSITTNGTQAITFAVNAIPGTDGTKARGEERFSIYSLQDFYMPESLISSKFIQIWPIADGSITGLAEGQTIGASVPQITILLNDLYPDSLTWAQVYRGSPRSGADGTIVPGSSIVLNTQTPTSRILMLSGYGAIFDSDGLWTMEVLTKTPFGTDRVTCVSFNVENHFDIHSRLLIKGNGVPIPDGTTIPIVGNNSDFGNVAASATSVIRTFAIHNTGTTPLSLYGYPKVAVSGSHATEFVVTRQPESPVAVGDSTSFDVKFSPFSTGVRSADLTIYIDNSAGNPYNFSIRGTGMTLDSWREANFGSSANSGDGADLNDFDHDELPNIVEFAFGLDPKQSSAGMLPMWQTIGNHRVISFTKPASASGISYGAEWSSTLAPDSWTLIQNTASPPEYLFSVPTETHPCLYLRLKVVGQ